MKKLSIIIFSILFFIALVTIQIIFYKILGSPLDSIIQDISSRINRVDTFSEYFDGMLSLSLLSIIFFSIFLLLPTFIYSLIINLSLNKTKFTDEFIGLIDGFPSLITFLSYMIIVIVVIVFIPSNDYIIIQWFIFFVLGFFYSAMGATPILYASKLGKKSAHYIEKV